MMDAVTGVEGTVEAAGNGEAAGNAGGTAALHVEVGHRLAGSGQRYSPVRRQIIEALAGADRPQSVADLVGSVPDLAISSAYRNLGVLTGAGAVARVATDEDAARFELAEALTERHHHHLVCTQCGLVLDYDPPDALERQVERGLDRVARECDFVAESHRLDIFGLCKDCVDCPAGEVSRGAL